MSRNPLVLMILDGWGYRKEQTHNAIAAAHTPQWDSWWATCPHILLNASGQTVGLPNNQMGNSEVGHMHIGAGRIILQDLTRINQSIAQGEFACNPALLNTLALLKKSQKTLHIMGLLSSGGVHSHEDHLFALLELCVAQKFSNIALHLFLDGRDTPPQSAMQSLARLEKYLIEHPIAHIASISGRYFAMDRDKRWSRIEQVYRVLTEHTYDNQANIATEALASYYKKNVYDEFVPPTRIGTGSIIESGDAVFFFNFRKDRARQLTEALISSEFTGFQRQSKPELIRFISMTHYAAHLNTECMFPPVKLHNTLGEVLAQQGLSQLRIAETEKYAHVTFFFNGGSEQKFINETRILIPSPHIATYDLKPEMSAEALTDELVKAITNRQYDVIICNYANADMVGHTGNFQATVKAIECLDQMMHTVGETLKQVNGTLLITADHGNAEAMFDDKTCQPHTAHTSEPVPLICVSDVKWQFNTSTGCLIDIAPTLLNLLNIPTPDEMTGHNLLSYEEPHE